MTKLDRWEVFGKRGETLDTLVWCLHCGRWYRLGDFRQVGDMQMCAYEGCDGDTVMDAKTTAMDGSEPPDDLLTES